MVSKAAVAGISLILVVGVIIGIVATVTRVEDHNNGGILSGMKAVEILCAPTDDKQLCMNTLTPAVKNNASVTPKELVQVYHEAVLAEVRKAFDKATSLAKDVNASYYKGSMKECQKLLTYAIDDLQDGISLLDGSEMQELGDLAADLNNWLGAVLSHKLFCLESLNKNPELNRAMQEGLANTVLQTSNALAIVNEIEKIVGNTNAAISARRLLGLNDDGFPTWLHDNDRKFMESDNSLIKPDVVVAQDGTGQYKSITEAIAAYPKNGKGRYIIYVKAGIYQEYIEVPASAHRVLMYGDGNTKTIITGDKAAGMNRYKTAETPTFLVRGRLFMAKSICFRNTAGPAAGQAVALGVYSDRSIFYDCAMEGYQDTLLTQAERQFYYRCVISGTIDFIWGSGVAAIKDSLIIVRLPHGGQFNAITADGRQDPGMRSGISIIGCRIIAEAQLEQQKSTTNSYLGRPWQQYARTMVMESDIGDFINPEGWRIWDHTNYHETCEYREYANHGPGAGISRRVKWPGFAVVTEESVARQYRPAEFLKGDPKVYQTWS